MEYTKEHTAVSAEASTIESSLSENIDQKINRIAGEWKIASTTLYNLVSSESNFDPEAVGDEGCSYGLVQINLCVHDITKEEALDPEFALNFAAKAISEGNEWWWTPCSCVSFARAMGAKLPRGNANDLFPNSTEIPAKRGVVILKYWNPDRHHVAYIESVTAEGLNIVESNFQPCKITRRFIHFSDKHIMGYYKDQQY